MENKANSKNSFSALNDDQIELSLLLENFYKALDNMVEAKVKAILNESDLLQLVPAEVTKINKEHMWVEANTGELLIRVPNKSNTMISNGDSVVLINRYGSNLRNSFLLCKNGQEIPLEKSIKNEINELQKQINALKVVPSVAN